MKRLSLPFALALFSLLSFGQSADRTRYVNPFVGTGGHGHTFPGATVPFGMVQLSPDTRIDNWDGSSGYHYSDDVIYGFSHTHLSGTGIPDGCDILFMPTSDSTRRFGRPIEYKQGTYEGFSSTFSHEDEKAEAGYYSVRLNDGKLLAELTATTRVGFHRYTFPHSNNAGIYLDLQWRDRTTDRDVKVVGDRRIEGFRSSTSWAKKQTVYFVAEFSKRFTGQGSGGPSRLGDDRPDGIFFAFDTRDGETIMLKVAISYVSIEGARKNLEAELPHWDFDKVRADAKAAWNRELSKIEVSGGTPEQTTNFYTALYHTMIHPNVFNDVDGKYLGHDRKIHQLLGYMNRRDAESQRENEGKNSASQRLGGNRSAQYTVFSLWDTFRAAHPLYTIIDQKRTADFINTFIRIYEQGGRLPVWELWGEETDTMIGFHAVSVIADAMAKDIKGFDYDKAYQAAKHSAELDHHGLAGYKRRGYISAEDDNESVSKTLEYAYNDWCLMKMASTLFNHRSLAPGGPKPSDAAYLKALGEDVDRYRRRSGNFENLFDARTGFMRPKRNGGFILPFAPEEVTFHFTEANSWQYTFFVPHDVTRLIQLMGGTEKFATKLDELFDTDAKLSGRFQPDITGLIGQYAHGNEPSHHIAYLYNYAGKPSQTQARVRRIMDEFYKPTPDGLIGNEDCGQMSAWYVLSASGFYPVQPGEKVYDLGSPIFKEVKFNLENGKKFIVRSPKVSPTNIYIASAKWNGRPHEATYFTHDHIASGGVLELEMSDRPNDRALSTNTTSSVFRDRPAVPSIVGERAFRGSQTITIVPPRGRVNLHYTTDGTEPESASPLYTEPFAISDTTIVKSFAVDLRGQRSPTVEAVFTRRTNDWKVTSTSGFSTQYPGGGEDALIDGLRGTANFASGEWQGYQGKTFEAVIDLARPAEVRELGGSFLQSIRSWIWMPAMIQFEASEDGINFKKVAEIRPQFPLEETDNVTREFRQTVTPFSTRYIRVRGYNIGPIPAWHPGAGGEPWIFVDEIFVQ